MPKGNNIIPNAHFHKHWQRRIKCWFDQPARKLRRRQARQAKAKSSMAPVGLLRSVVRCPSVRYNGKMRLGRGFTLAELKSAQLSKLEAKKLGIAVDYRRTNRSTEGLQVNVDRLKRFKAGLIVFPKSVNDLNKQEPIEIMPLTEELKKFEVYKHLRRVRADKRLHGKREKKAREIADEGVGGAGVKTGGRR